MVYVFSKINWLMQYLFLEANYDLLYEINMLTSYSLQLSSYEGFQINLNQSQNETLFEVVNVIERVSLAIRSNKAVGQISLYTKQINIFVTAQNEFNDVDSTLAFLVNYSSSATNSAGASQFVSIITNYTTTLQSLGKTRAK